MVRGIYTAAMGMLTDVTKLDTVSNNLANINTTGYRKDLPTFATYAERMIYAKEFQKMRPIGNLEHGVVLDRVYNDVEQGMIQESGNSLDFAIEGEGFFALEIPGSGVFYSRAGNFKINQQNQLVNADGLAVLDENGNYIYLTEDFQVDRGGYIKDPAGNIITRLGIYAFANPSTLQKVGYTLYQPTQESGQPIPAENFRIMQGYIELSNVNAVREMIKMIEAQRHFEFNQRVVVTEDQMLAKLMDQVASLR